MNSEPQVTVPLKLWEQMCEFVAIVPDYPWTYKLKTERDSILDQLDRMDDEHSN